MSQTIGPVAGPRTGTISDARLAELCGVQIAARVPRLERGLTPDRLEVVRHFVERATVGLAPSLAARLDGRDVRL